VPKPLHARVPEDLGEESKIRKLAGSRRAPGDWIFRARIVSLSWQGLRTAKVAEELCCHPKTVRTRLHRFNAEGVDGLGDRRSRRLSESAKLAVPGFMVSEDIAADAFGPQRNLFQQAGDFLEVRIHDCANPEPLVTLA
jgi:hypothetical protein